MVIAMKQPTLCRVACVVALASLALNLSGCSVLNQALSDQVNPRPPVDLAPVRYARPDVAVEAPPNNGAIFQAVTYRPLFEDYRARLKGDSLTIQIVEKINATQRSTSSIVKISVNASGVRYLVWCAKSAPAKPVTPAESTNASTFTRPTGMPKE